MPSFAKFLSLFTIFVLVACAADCFAIGGKGPLERENSLVENKKLAVSDKIGIDEHLGEKIDLGLTFTDDAGQEVKLGKYFKDKPVFLVLIYYQCPTLCSLHLNALIQTFKDFEWKIGDKFEFVAVSIDPDESYRLGAQKKQAYLEAYGDTSTVNGWHFLTGKEENIKKLASQIGFRYAWDQNQQQWAHAAAGYILTTDGTISYYHYGLNVVPKVLRLSLVEASNHKIGTVMDRLVLFCLQYDPTKKTYSFYAYNIMRVAAILMVLVLGFFMFRFWRSQRNIID